MAIKTWKEILINIFSNLITWWAITLVGTFFAAFSYGARYATANLPPQLRWLDIEGTIIPGPGAIFSNMLLIIISIFGICFLFITRKKPKEFISDYNFIDSCNKASAKIDLNSNMYFIAFTHLPESENDLSFPSYIYIQGPCCKKCKANLISILNPITKNLRYYYYSNCDRKYILEKKFKKNFLPKIRNLCKKYFIENVSNYISQ